MEKLESFLVNIDQIFKDDRGYIKTLFNLKSNNVSLIFSKKNSIRSNHYHLTDWHYIYVIKGAFEYYYKSLKKYSKIKKILVKKNQMIFTPAKEIHATKFLQDTLLVVISKNPRDQKNYEKDLVRKVIIS